MQEKIRPGYKQTEFGVIPEDWQVSELDALVDPDRTIRYGIVQPGPFNPRGRLLIRGQDYSRGWVDASEMFRVGPEIERRYRNARVVTNDLIITIVGASTGEVARVPDWLDGANLTQTTARVAIDRRRACSDYVLYVLQSPIGAQSVSNYIKGGAQPGLNCGDVKRFLVPLPPSRTEQRAIAEALSDADARIAALEALIAKKRDLKQAAMQQLLTGKTRLPGFSGDWEVKRLGELLDYEQPTKHLVQSTEYDESYDIPVLTAGKSFYLGRTNETHGVCRNLPVIIFDDFTTATQFVNFPFKAKSSAMKLLRPRDRNTDIKLVYALMQGIKFTMSDHKRYWISEYQKIELPFPGPVEQAAIGEILSDMDAELAALEAEAEKARTIKHGMMQNLLTGKVRLV